MCACNQAENAQTIVIRGGCVYFEPGALGGRFVGVFFVEDPNPAEVKLTTHAVERLMGLTSLTGDDIEGLTLISPSFLPSPLSFPTDASLFRPLSIP